MRMYDDLMAIRQVLANDSELLKLLYYKSENTADDPKNKTSILELDPPKKMDIINHRIKYTPATDDLADTPICRIIFYPAPRKPQAGNYAVARQEISFDVIVHKDYNDTDMRLAKITDRLNTIISNEKLTQIGKTLFIDGHPINIPAENYIAYRLVYSFGSLT